MTWLLAVYERPNGTHHSFLQYQGGWLLAHHSGLLAVNQLHLWHPRDLLYHPVGYSQTLSNGIKISVLVGNGGSSKSVPSLGNLPQS